MVTTPDAHSSQLCPEKGQFTAYKKVMCGVILELIIPETAQRVSRPGSRKCRASSVKVVSATRKDGSPVPSREIFFSLYFPSFTYVVGEVREVKDYNGDPSVECAPGIHFFMTREEAVTFI